MLLTFRRRIRFVYYAMSGSPSLASNPTSAQRAHQARILATLADICSSLERLQTSEEARLACREVGRLLSSAASRGPTAPGRKPARRHAKSPHPDR